MKPSAKLTPLFKLSSFTLLFLAFSAFIFNGCGRDDSPNENSSDITNSTSEELKIRSEFANESDFVVVTDDVFAIWWDKRFDYSNDVAFILETFKELRQDCLNNLAMKDPPNVSAGYYLNIYIHHNERDGLPNGWGNGVGTNSFDLPYMTLPEGAHLDYNNLLHEGFHLFQYSSNSPGFEYSGDTAWYVESSAQWYTVSRNKGAIDTFIEIETLTSNPHLALWHSFDNEAPGDPTDWLFQVRQYAMQAWLFYMTEVEGVNQNLVTNGFYSGTTLSPQEYHYENVGGSRLREIFANWAARNTLDFDYLTREQVARAKEELNNVADLNNRQPYVLQLDDTNILGTHTPPENLRPRGWAYNVIKLENLALGTYTIQIVGDVSGSEGALSHFDGRFITKGKSELTKFEMASDTTGQVTIEIPSGHQESYIIIAAMPEFFESAQSYNYSITIDKI